MKLPFGVFTMTDCVMQAFGNSTMALTRSRNHWDKWFIGFRKALLQGADAMIRCQVPSESCLITRGEGRGRQEKGCSFDHIGQGLVFKQQCPYG